MPKLGTRGGKHRTPGPHETPEFCTLWEAKRAAGEIPPTMTGHRDGYARAFTWGQRAERERCAKLCEDLGRGLARDEVSAQDCADAIRGHYLVTTATTGLDPFLAGQPHDEWLKAKPEAAERAQWQQDAERYHKLRRDFSAMSVNIDGNHAWVYRRNYSLHGPTLDAALDAVK